MPKATAEQKKIIERIRKLLMMAGDTSSPNEAAIAAKRAESLMRKHQLESASIMVEETNDSDVSTESVDSTSAVYGDKYKGKTVPTWVGIVSYGVAKMNECFCDKDDGIINFHGVSGDAQVAMEIFRYLVKETMRQSRKFKGSRAEKNDFRLGCAGALQDRCFTIAKEREKQFEEVKSGKELVILKQALIEKATKRKMKGAKVPIRRSSAHSEGERAGKKISLNSQLTGGNTSAAQLTN